MDACHPESAPPVTGNKPPIGRTIKVLFDPRATASGCPGRGGTSPLKRIEVIWKHAIRHYKPGGRWANLSGKREHFTDLAGLGPKRGNVMTERQTVTIDGNEAAAYIAHKVSEVIGRASCRERV